MSFHHGPFTQRGRGVGNLVGSLFTGVIPLQKMGGNNLSKSESVNANTCRVSSERSISRKRKTVTEKPIDCKVKKGEVVEKNKTSSKDKQIIGKKNVGLPSTEKRKKYGDIFEWEESDSNSNVTTDDSNDE
jgi:hypothetical protein